MWDDEPGRLGSDLGQASFHQDGVYTNAHIDDDAAAALVRDFEGLVRISATVTNHEDGSPVEWSTMDAVRVVFAIDDPANPDLDHVTVGRARISVIEHALSAAELSLHLDEDGGLYEHAENLFTRREAADELVKGRAVGVFDLVAFDPRLQSGPIVTTLLGATLDHFVLRAVQTFLIDPRDFSGLPSKVAADALSGLPFEQWGQTQTYVFQRR